MILKHLVTRSSNRSQKHRVSIRTKKIHRLEENLGAMDLEISDSDWNSLMKDLSTIKIEGDRYDEHGMKMVGL